MLNLRRQELIQALPYARRYARALAGGREAGDKLVALSLKALLEDDTLPQDGTLPAQHSLYAAITQRHAAAEGARAPEGGLSLDQRALLLLTSLEELPLPVAARILGLEEARAAIETEAARAGLQRVAEASVLIIEDEPIIAMDIQDLVERCGHRVAGVAHTEADAIAIAERERPGLILADINLGLGGDGMVAVGRIMDTLQVPVIFVTAYPERLLTGEHHEPPFVITKPFEPLTLAITTYQAVTGGLKTV